MSIHAIGSAPRFIDSGHISTIRPCKQRNLISDSNDNNKRFFALTIGGREILFPADTQGLEELIHCWYGPGWTKAYEAINWASASDVTGMGYEQ